MALNVVILAGGAGTRLWPMSRVSSPKQLQNLVGEDTLIQQTYERVLTVADKEHIYVATVAKYVPEMRAQLPDLARDHYITEPMLKNNAAAIGLCAIHLHKQDPQSIMASLHSDHAITKPQHFTAAIHLAEDILAKYPDHLVTVGIKPENPSTELGYIEMAKALTEVGSQTVYTVKRFVEKPDSTSAKAFVESGRYLWNAGYFIWRVDTLLKLYEQFLPNTYKRLRVIEQAIGTPQYEEVLHHEYAQMDEIAIDYAILEHAPHMAVIPADLGWSDIGTWSALHDILTELSGHHVISRGRHVDEQSQNTLVFAGEKMIATVGLKDVIIVDTPDALLVADKSRASEVKKILEKLKAEGKHTYL